LEQKNSYIKYNIDVESLRKYKEGLTEGELEKFNDDIGNWFFWDQIYKMLTQPQRLRFGIMIYKSGGEEDEK